MLYERDSDRKAARKALGLPKDRIVLGFVGNVRPYKNVPLLIDAFARLPRGVAVLLLAGKQQPPLDCAAIGPELCAEMVIHDAVIEETALPRYLAACDAVVLPFGRILTSGSLMLALSLETPVIVPAVPTLMETVTDRENGLVFSVDDAESLAERLAFFISLGDRERAAMRAAAGQTARLCDWGWIGRQIADRLHALLPTD
jgi:glycosyltransferase involved in cell wall biosynthesis